MFLNNMEDKPMEIEATHAASILYGSTGFTSTHKFWNIYLSAAMIHVRENCALLYPQDENEKKEELFIEEINKISNKRNKILMQNDDDNNSVEEIPDLITTTNLEKKFENLNIQIDETLESKEHEICFSGFEKSITDEVQSDEEEINCKEDDENNINDTEDKEEIYDNIYPYVDIDELAFIDIMENQQRQYNDEDRGVREVVFDVDKNPLLLMQHDYYK